MRPRHAWLIVLAVCALPYLAGLRHGFVYDDHGTIEENEFLRHPANLWRVITLQTLNDPRVLDGQRPVLLLTHFAERALWGLNPFGYHLDNLLLHLGVVSLVYVFARRVNASAFASAALFGLHPLLSEVVQVPSYREDLLAALFGLAFLLAAPRKRSLILLALALLSKESALVLPVLLAWVWMCYPEKNPGRKKAAALLGAGAGLVVLFALVENSGRGLQAASGVWNGYSLPFPRNLWAGPDLFLEYLRLLVVPWPLNADRVFVAPDSFLSLRFIIGIVGTLAAAALAFGLRRVRPLPALGIGWMLIAFIPVSNLIPLFNPMADRYAYFMAIGFALVLSAALRPVTLATLCALYIWLITQRLPDWSDDHTLWTRTGQQNPGSARAHTWVGLEMKARGHRDVAARHFRDADKINPQDVTALINLAILDGESGDLTHAEARLRESVRRRPDKREAYENLIVALEKQNKTHEADEVRREYLRRGFDQPP